MKYLFMLAALAISQGALAQQWHKISGRVLDSNNLPVAGVVVNNGIYFTQSDAQGKWTLDTDTALCKFVSVSTPAEYELSDRDFHQSLRRDLLTDHRAEEMIVFPSAS